MEAINWHSFFFLLFALASCAFAVAVVVSSNIVRMAFYLTLSLGGTAGLFFLAGADFVGAMQLLIYVGGTLVLLIFGVMLTAQGPFISMRTSGGDWMMAFILSGCLLGLLIPAAFSVPGWRNDVAQVAELEPMQEASLVQPADAPAAAESAEGDAPSEDAEEESELIVGPPLEPTSTALGAGLLGMRVDRLDADTPEALKPGMSGYLLPFEIVSVHLLVVLIGAAYLARAKRRARPSRPSS